MNSGERITPEKLRSIKSQTLTNSILITLVALVLEGLFFGYMIPEGIGRPVPLILLGVIIGILTPVKCLMNLSRYYESRDLVERPAS